MRATYFLFGIVLCFGFVSCSDRKPPLVDLPVLDMTKFLPAVRARIEPAYSATRISPKDPRSVGQLGMLLDAHNQYDAAAACYERARALDPLAFRWEYYLGNIHLVQGKPVEAIADLRRALQIDPNYIAAHAKLANSLLLSNKLSESEAEYRFVLERNPDNAAANYGLGRVFAASGDVSKSVEHYLKACDLFPNYGAAHYALALTYRKQGLTGQSNRHFRLYEGNKTATPSEDDPLRREVAYLNAGAMSHVRRGAELEQAGKIQDAIAEHERALQIDPKLVQAHVNLISLYGRLGQVATAETHFQASLNLDPKQADAYYNYGVLLFNRKQYTEAEKEFRQALSINPYHAQAHHNLGFLFEQRGEIAKALAEYESATTSQADYGLAHFHAGRILANQKKYGPAIAHFLKAIHTEDERTPGYLYALAAAYARSGNRSEAVKFARRARTGAAAFGQSDLLASIAKDLAILERP